MPSPRDVHVIAAEAGFERPADALVLAALASRRQPRPRGAARADAGRARAALRVAVLPACDDETVRLLAAAADLSKYAPTPGAFDWVRRELLDEKNPWRVLADLGAYIHRRDEALAEFADPRAFTEKAILTLARARRFWVDRLEIGT